MNYSASGRAIFATVDQKWNNPATYLDSRIARRAPHLSSQPYAPGFDREHDYYIY